MANKVFDGVGKKELVGVLAGCAVVAGVRGLVSSADRQVLDGDWPVAKMHWKTSFPSKWKRDRSRDTYGKFGRPGYRVVETAETPISDEFFVVPGSAKRAVSRIHANARVGAALDASGEGYSRARVGAVLRVGPAEYYAVALKARGRNGGSGELQVMNNRPSDLNMEALVNGLTDVVTNAGRIRVHQGQAL